MDFVRTYIKNIWSIATWVTGTIAVVFSTFVFSIWGQGVIHYYCTARNFLFGFDFSIYAICPFVVVITYIIFISIGILFLVFILAMLLNFIAWLNEKIFPIIDFMEIHDHDSKDIDSIRYNYACLQVVNRGYEEITECYAILRKIYTFQAKFGLVDLTSFFGDVANKRLHWKNNNSNCEIKISPFTGQEILRIYRLGVEGHRKVISDFNICDENYKGANSGNNNGVTDYFFQLEIYGKIKNENIRPKKFFGLVKIEFLKRDNGTMYGLGVWKISNFDFFRLKLVGLKLKLMHWIKGWLSKIIKMKK